VGILQFVFLVSVVVFGGCTLFVFVFDLSVCCGVVGGGLRSYGMVFRGLVCGVYSVFCAFAMFLGAFFFRGCSLGWLFFFASLVVCLC